MVVVLTMIPYIGIIICWVPAVLIAAFQWGDWTASNHRDGRFSSLSRIWKAFFMRHALSETLWAYIR